jgi:hypothetical protein
MRMDLNIEVMAADIGLKWRRELYYDANEEQSPGGKQADNGRSSELVFSDGFIGGVEAFEPPPTQPLTFDARRLLLGCRGEWKERVMPLPTEGVRIRYRKPKYWIISVAAANGWTPEEVDARVGNWFEEGKGEGIF